MLRGSVLPASEMVRKVSYAVMALNAGAIVGYLAFPPIAERLGRRPAFAIMLTGSAVMLPATFFAPSSYGSVLLLLPSAGVLFQRPVQRVPDLPA